MELGQQCSSSSSSKLDRRGSMARPNSARGSGGRERVQVVVRCRPMSHKETADGRQTCVSVDTENKTVEIRSPAGGKRGIADKVFTFDHVYDAKCTQRELYKEVAHPIVQSVMHGYNGTVLAYGQTASGKTYTMEGFDDQPGMITLRAECRGIIPSAFEDIFAHITQSQSSNHFLVRASYLEIYNEEIRDLLAPSSSPGTKLELKESSDSGVFVKNLTSLTVHSLSDITRLLMVGKKNRSVGATLMNQDSSRSHSIFSITVETSVQPVDNATTDELHVRVGKLNLVDLAGSERMSKTEARGERFKELTNINWSLTALGNVISALADGKSTHIPYRDSKLTRLLQDSLGGNTRTVMVANIGPADYNYEESVSTLRYANRAKSIRNAPRINEDPKDTLLREFQAEIFRLKAQLSTTGPSHDDLAKEISMLKYEKESVQKHLEEMKAQRVDTSFCQSFSEQALSYIKADLERKAHVEIEFLKAEKERSEEEKKELSQQLLQQLKSMQVHYEAVAREKEDREALANKLRSLEEKLLHGSNNDSEKLAAKAKQQEQELALYEQHLQERQHLDEERERKIMELEEAQLLAEVKCNTMEEELEVKTSKLRKLTSCYQQTKLDFKSLQTELQDTIHEFHEERTDLLLALRSLEQQHQLKSLIIEEFIPADEVSKIMKRVQWNDESETWVLPSMISQMPCCSSSSSGLASNSSSSNNSSIASSYVVVVDPMNKQPLQRPGSAIGRSRPLCQQGVEALSRNSHDPRYSMDNVLNLGMETHKLHRLYDYDNHLERAQAQAEVRKSLAAATSTATAAALSSRTDSAPLPAELRPRTANH